MEAWRALVLKRADGGWDSIEVMAGVGAQVF